MRRRSFSLETEEPTINLTPLIDVVFVVLIIFILIAPMLDVDKVSLAPGKEAKESHKIEASSLTIHVQADNSILIQSKPVLPEQLFSFLLQEKRKNPQQIPQLFQDKRASFGTYQLIKNAVESAGFEELDVLLQPSS